MQKSNSLKTMPLKQIENALKLAQSFPAVSRGKDIETKKSNLFLMSSAASKSDLLRITKEAAISAFLVDLKLKNQCEIKASFEEKVEELMKKASEIIKTAEREKEDFKEQYMKYKKKNEELNERINGLKMEIKVLKNENKDFEEQLSEFKQKFEVFKDAENLLETFLMDFEGKSPREIIEELRTRQNEYVELIKNYNEVLRKNKENLKHSQNQSKLTKENYVRATDRIKTLEKIIKANEEDFEQKANHLKKQITLLKSYQSQNEILHKMLYQIYNKLFESFRLDRGVREVMDKRFEGIKEKDFTPNVFDDEELFKYINIMISSMKETTSHKLLRETLAYANMIVREFFPEKVSLRFDPCSTFRSFRSLLKGQKEEIKKLKEKLRAAERRSE